MDARTPPDGSVAGVSTAVFDALAAIQGADDKRYGRPALFDLIRAIWSDAAYSVADEDLARELRTDTRPLTITDVQGRTLTFAKIATADVMRLQSEFLPGEFQPQDASYYAEVFSATKDAGVLVGACHANPEGAELMDRILTDMVNVARFAAKTQGDKPITRLFDALRAAHAAAPPEIAREFAAAMRTVLAKFASDATALPASVRNAEWLTPPPLAPPEH